MHKVIKTLCFLTCLIISLGAFIKVSSSDSPFSAPLTQANSTSKNDYTTYDDSTLNELATLQRRGFFKNKTIGIWAIDESVDEHGEIFGLHLGAKYLIEQPENCHIVSDITSLTPYDYIIVPYDIYQLEQLNYQLIHRENWLYIYSNKHP